MAHKKKYIVITGILLSVIVVAVLAATNFSNEKTEKFYTVERGEFEAVLNCKGEINGLKATEIKAPRILGDRDLRLYGMQITNLVQDGKSVKKGEFVMQLDVSTISSGMREERQKLEKELADLNNAKIDSTVKLTQLREEIKNALLDLEYNKIDLELSIYESEAEQRKIQMTYHKALNNIAKKKRDYLLEQNKLKTRVKRAEENVENCNIKLDKFKQAMKAARITAPEDGIIIIGKNWDGKKYSKDDQVSTSIYARPYATLPDMSQVISEIYVKEIDIAKIKVGDSVRVSFDAIADLSINGFIKNIARVGEDHKDYDMKVFKVVIQLEQSDDGLKPAMTSNNDIILARYDTALFVPVNAVFRDNGNRYVFLKGPEGTKKQVVTTGLENEEFIVIKEGLSEGDRIMLEPPVNPELAQN